MFLCGDSFDFLMAWKVSLLLYGGEKKGGEGGDGERRRRFNLGWTREEGREKSRERVCSLRFREDEEKEKKSVFVFVRSLIHCTQYGL